MKKLSIWFILTLFLTTFLHSESVTMGVEVVKEAGKIQEALDRLGKEGGGILFLPAGTYSIEKTLKIPSNVILRGAGAGTILKPTITIGERQYPDNRVISNADVEGGNKGIIIEDLVIDGELLGEYHKTGIYGISLNNCDNCIIRNVIVRRCSGEGILVSYGKGNTIVENCIVEENNHGINIHHIEGAVLLRNNICKRNGFHKPEYGGIGIFVEGVENISIIGNVCQDNAWAGIVWMGGVDEARGIKYPSKDCLIANNICIGNGSQGGIFLNGTYSDTRRFLVNANICKENKGNGIWGFKVREGVISSNLSLNNKGWGISLVESEGITIANNLALGNDKGGIEANKEKNIVVNNL
jgi:parallel beta-helix repeat protein